MNGNAQPVYLSGSVGLGGRNAPADVIAVKKLLNARMPRLAPGFLSLPLTGTVDRRTIEAIERFQRLAAGFAKPDGRVDPGCKTLAALIGAAAGKVERLAVAVHTWQGKKPTRGFRLCAETAAAAAVSAKPLVRYALTKGDFVNLFGELAGRGEVTEFHLYSHSGMDGPIFHGGEQVMPHELWAGALPRLKWAAGARANLYGCNAGLAPWSVVFSHTQGVVVTGSAGFSLFSKRADAFYPFDGDPDTVPCYLDCFRGTTEIYTERYGGRRSDHFIEELWRTVSAHLEAREVRKKHLPPKRRIVIRPDGTVQK